MIEEGMVGWHHQLNGHESEQTRGDSEGQGSLACCSPWDCKESEHDLATEQQQSFFFFNDCHNQFNFFKDFFGYGPF